jgi:hypothetical protein
MGLLHICLLYDFSFNFNFFLSLKVGLGPPRTQPNDIICILLGCSVPIILRQDGRNFMLLGESYTHSLMHGEVLKGVETGLFSLQEFRIV